MVYVQPALATPIGEHASMACRAVLPYSKRLCLVSFLKQERNYFYMYYFAGEIISILIVVFCGGCFLQSPRFRPNRRPLKTPVPVLYIALHLMQRDSSIICSVDLEHVISTLPRAIWSREKGTARPLPGHGLSCRGHDSGHRPASPPSGRRCGSPSPARRSRPLYPPKAEAPPADEPISNGCIEKFPIGISYPHMKTRG